MTIARSAAEVLRDHVTLELPIEPDGKPSSWLARPSSKDCMGARPRWYRACDNEDFDDVRHGAIYLVGVRNALALYRLLRE